MLELNLFKNWIKENKDYSPRTTKDIISRLKRADNILKFINDDIYFFYLEKEFCKLNLSNSVQSQVKHAVTLYREFLKTRNNRIKVLSLFSNIGVAEAYLESIGVDICVANEIEERRAKLYSSIYPNTKMICGDINNSQIKSMIINSSKALGVNTIIATPPCQGMSTAGQQLMDDERNLLICPVIDIIKEIKPLYVVLENVPLFLKTSINVSNRNILIPDYIKESLESEYHITFNIINTKDFEVPQTRERAIVLLSKKSSNNKVWALPVKADKEVTLADAIGDLPSIDPFVSDIEYNEFLRLFPEYEYRKKIALSISKWHIPPTHIFRQVIAMQHTPTGQTAFDNEIYFPKKSNGAPVKGYRNTYKRQHWDKPAYTITMDNRKISSQNNVHPGRLIDKNLNIYSDARVFTLYEIMLVMSLPRDWPIPEGTSEAFLRRIIGEGIPPLFIKKLFEMLI